VFHRVVGIIRLGHPFPSLLNAGATFAIATLAGAPLPAALRLGASMLAIQVAIGALNDHVDAPRDAIAKPAKPIPAGLASRQEGLGLAAVAGALGIMLSAVSGLPTAGVAALGLGLGVAYDVRLSATRWSWLPLALALPLVPLHAWLGASGAIPGGLLPLLPAGVLAGTALAVANGLVDAERDAATRRPATVVALGATRAWWLHLALLAAVAALALLLAPGAGEDAAAGGASDGLPGPLLRSFRTWGLIVGLAAVALGAVALRLGRPGLRERGWELEAVGIAAVGLGWLAGVAASAGGLAG
jgi:4-hydroxybenzoate polyprenyltransferase